LSKRKKCHSREGRRVSGSRVGGTVFPFAKKRWHSFHLALFSPGPGEPDQDSEEDKKEISKGGGRPGWEEPLGESQCISLLRGRYGALDVAVGRKSRAAESPRGTGFPAWDIVAFCVASLIEGNTFLAHRSAEKRRFPRLAEGREKKKTRRRKREAEKRLKRAASNDSANLCN